MKLLNCPLNGPRNIAEFTYGGELQAMPDPATADARQWAEHIFFPENEAGVVTEWWCHRATAYWFLARRNRLTDEIIQTFPPSEVFKRRMEFAGKDGSEKP